MMSSPRAWGLLVVAALAGCTEQSNSNAAQATAEPNRKAVEGLQQLRDFDVVSGRMSVRATTSRGGSLTLWAGGRQVGSSTASPHRFDWDTTGVPDGLVDLALRRGAEEVDRARVVVLNRGAEVFFKNGSGGKIEVPPTGYRNQHLRYHWDLTDGARRILAILVWDQEGFDLELALGRGTCPHHGEQVAARHADRSPVTLVHEAPAGGTLPTGQWFAHVRLMNPNKVLGSETPFSVRAYVMR